MIADFFELKGESLIELKVDETNNQILIETDKANWRIHHVPDCCEWVTIQHHTTEQPRATGNIIEAWDDCDPLPDYDFGYTPDSFTWTRYHLKTAGGLVFNAWVLGESNGYYCETMTVSRTEKQNGN